MRGQNKSSSAIYFQVLYIANFRDYFFIHIQQRDDFLPLSPHLLFVCAVREIFIFVVKTGKLLI